MVSRAVMSWEVAMPIDSERGLGRDPDEILRQIKEAEESDERSLGKLKIFFGYAAGVGKTYAMLEEAQDLKRKGIDVVAGYIEPHARAETAAMAEGLEAVETRAVEHKGIDLRELDTDAVLSRRPQVVLVDELAHTNAPGSRHRKRYQDIEELLHAGINVLTTVNVQHLEGLNDKIASISHITVAERVPDYVFDQADMVELIDIEPDDLIERLQAGKIYLPERSRTALSNFFSRTNLGALREIALRRMADRMARRSVVDPSSRTDAGEDVLVLLTSSPDNAKAVRAAANMAEAYHGHLTAVMVEASRSSRQDAATRHRLRENLELAEELGGEAPFKATIRPSWSPSMRLLRALRSWLLKARPTTVPNHGAGPWQTVYPAFPTGRASPSFRCGPEFKIALPSQFLLSGGPAKTSFTPPFQFRSPPHWVSSPTRLAFPRR